MAVAWGTLLACATAFTSSPAQAQTLPAAGLIAQPHEHALVAEVNRLVTRGSANPDRRLRQLDDLLARMPQPSPLRGLVQYHRAVTAWGSQRSDRSAIASEAITQSVQLLPRYSLPLLLAFVIETYSDRPRQAAAHLLRAAELDPEAVRGIDGHHMASLFSRMGTAELRPLRRQVAERLLETGWPGAASPPPQALLELALQARLDRGDVTGAEALLSRLSSPRDIRRLLIQNRYRLLWARAEQLAGPRLENLWRSYLADQRARWLADPSQARPYAIALEEAGHAETLVRELLPLVSGGVDPDKDYPLLWVVPSLANALAQLGRWEDVERVYRRTNRVWGVEGHANALNLTANRARHLLMRGDAAGALHAFDAALRDASRGGGEVSTEAIAMMQYFRVCALHELGRDAETAPGIAFVASRAASPVTVATMYLCIERPELARDTLIAALADEELRADVLEFLQPIDAPLPRSDYGRVRLERILALVRDPELIAAATQHGRILPYALNAGAPPQSAADAAPRP